ncbi:hypothetical protein [Marinomonas sp. GJ51-6]|uniref:hypothetical protein n=1 Tax=Marinomonas sp. GJ51-6 TaxID=2992802 RepID=UPI0029342548|nr:hypothetical protein [Marinomonas sp. GJ51-6]WOD09394.1 hypothetical protein ONZ50_10600 [Marinomonas sp. GJ51-6]
MATNESFANSIYLYSGSVTSGINYGSRTLSDTADSSNDGSTVVGDNVAIDTGLYGSNTVQFIGTTDNGVVVSSNGRLFSFN